MECLYCHKSFSSFRFWKSSEFCSQEHAEQYRNQTLDRLMGGASAANGEKTPLPLPLSAILGPEQEPALAGPPRLHAAPPEKEQGPARLEAPKTAPVAASSQRPMPLITPPPTDLRPSVEEILARAGKHDIGAEAKADSWQRAPLSQSHGTDVGQQTAEEALEALRSLARGSKSGGAKPADAFQDAPSFPEWEDAVIEAGTGEATEDADADDVFAELRRIAGRAGEAHDEDASDSFEPATPIPSLSALDRLTETPKPRPREAVPALSLPTKQEQAATVKTEVAAEIPEPEIIHAGAEEAAEAAPLAEAESTPVEEQRTKDVGDKVVSFPSQSKLRRKDFIGHANGSAAAGSSLFSPEIHSEFAAVDLDGVFGEAAEFALSTAVAFDETLKAPAADMNTTAEPAVVVKARAYQGFRSNGAEALELGPAIRSLISNAQGRLGNGDAREPEFHSGMIARREFLRPGGFGLYATWRNCIAAPVLDEVSGADASGPISPEPKPPEGSLTPALPAGLLEKMGVTRAGGTGQLVRSELFHKEPEVREFPLSRTDGRASRPDDVRRVYYA